MSKRMQKLRSYLDKSNELLLTTSEELKAAQIMNTSLKAERTVMIEAYNYLLVAVRQELDNLAKNKGLDVDGAKWLDSKGFKRIVQSSSSANLIDLLTDYMMDENESD